MHTTQLLLAGHQSGSGYLTCGWGLSDVTHVTGLLWFGLEAAPKEKKMQDEVSMLRAVGSVENTFLGPIPSLVSTACFAQAVPFTAMVSAFGGEV